MYFFYYIPVGIDTEARRFPIMTTFFALMCAVVFAINKYWGAASGLDFYKFIYYPGFSGWASVVAAVFLHFGYFHLIGNLVYLILFGTYLEGRLGPVLYTVLFLGSGAIGNFVQGWYNGHVLNVDAGIIGASGAISGILGSFLVRLHHNRVRVAYWVFAPLLAYTRAGRSDVPVVVALALWVLLQSVRSLVQLEGASANVAHVTHLAGFVSGVVLTVATGGWRHGRQEGYLLRAGRYLKRGEFYGAQDELSRYVAGRPDDGEAHAQLARVLIQIEDNIGARAEYLKACELILRSGRRGRAEAIYSEAVRGFPDFTLSPEPHLDLVFGLERSLKPAAALKAYENFMRAFPRHEEVAFALLRSANLHLKAFGNAAEAEACYRELVERHPMDPWADFALEQIRKLELDRRSPHQNLSA
jgi:membrane associated rhomboid family serine protease